MKDTKKILFSSVIVLVLSLTMVFSIHTAYAKDLTFQWNQDTMVSGDKWEMHVSEVAGGPYSHLVDIPYTESQTVYEKVVTVDIPTNGYYFVLKKVRGSDGASSDWSNEVYFKLVDGPFQLKLIFEGGN